jgi:ATP adenylyltransferase
MKSTMTERNQNLWAPWRLAYIRDLDDENRVDGCFLCHYWQHPEEDERNHVLLRREHAFAVLNRFPYTSGHLLIAPSSHEGDFTALTDEQLTDSAQLIRDAIRILRATYDPQGFNVGYNLGRSSGAGLPEHLHAHVVPRWSGDTNFMSVIGDVRVIPQALEDSFAEMREQVQKLGLAG